MHGNSPTSLPTTVVLAAKVGDRVAPGQPLCHVHRNAGGEPIAVDADGSYAFQVPSLQPWLIEVVTSPSGMSAKRRSMSATDATDTKKVSGSYAYVSPSGKNLGRTGVVLGVKYNF